MKLKNVGFKQVTRCGWSDGAYRIPVDETAEVPDALGLRLLSVFPGAFVVVEDATATPEGVDEPAVEPVETEDPPKGGRRKRRIAV